MIFFADENLDIEIVQRLRSFNHEVIYAAEQYSGAPDDQILHLANHNNSILITADKDFGELAFRQNLVHKGIILIRLHGIDLITKAEIVSNYVEHYKNKLENCFSVITPKNIRIRSKLNPIS